MNKLDYIEINPLEGNVLHVKICGKLVIKEHHLDEIWSQIDSNDPDKKRKLLIEICEGIYPGKGVKEIAKQRASQWPNKIAYKVPDLYIYTILRIMMKIHQNAEKINVFEEIEPALEWLKRDYNENGIKEVRA